MLNLLNWLKGNFKTVIEFLKEHSIKILIHSKETKEVKREIEINNFFFLICIILILCIIFSIGRIKTIFFP
jgi:hypothetical protein